jgi:hypothetical protein
MSTAAMPTAAIKSMIEQVVPGIQAQLNLVDEFFTTYINAKNASSVISLIEQKQQLEGGARDKIHRLNELNHLDETYTQTYLDSKAHPIKGGVFARYGFHSTQDWILAFYYFSFTLFSVIIILYTFINSVQKIFASVLMFCVLAVVAILTTLWIQYYG